MKKLWIFLMLMPLGLLAQKKVRFGLKAGLNSSKITNTSLHSREGAYAGALLDLRFNRAYSLQPEIVYSDQGANSMVSPDNDLRIQYVSIALANRFFVDGRSGFHIILGPSLDMNFEDNWIHLVNEGFDSDSEATFLDVAVFGGLGYEFGFGLVLEGRFKQGLITVDPFDDQFHPEFDEDGANLNAVFQLGMAYKF